MNEEEVRSVVKYVRSHQPRFHTDYENTSMKVSSPEDYFWCDLYDRRSELLKGSKEYDDKMDEIYIQNYLRSFDPTRKKNMNETLEDILATPEGNAPAIATLEAGEGTSQEQHEVILAGAVQDTEFASQPAN